VLVGRASAGAPHEGAGPELAAGFLLVGVLAAVAEEPGWRGYAQRGLEPRLPVAVAGLVIGIVWAIWHLPLAFIDGTYQHGLRVGGTGLALYLLAIELVVADPRMRRRARGISGGPPSA
jgi:uncharacterized protein